MNHPKSLFLAALLVLLAGCAATPTDVAIEPGSDVISKSPNDDRDYRHLVLANGLRVVLISDLAADKSAAALTAFRGSFDDPPDRLGLAHFLEHMLFIGTEKYPEPDGYFNFVQSHGGGSNAYTASEHTNYFFDIKPENFHEGLDRFSQFFIAPLFTKEYVEREKNAVNSEYQLQMKEDNWRGFTVQKMAANPDHPISTFNIGSLETLAGDVHSALLRFFNENYSANQMGLVVLTNESLDDMEPWVTEMFLPIENRELSPIVREMPIFVDNQIPATLSYQSIRQQHSVSYTFPIPSLREYYRTKPMQYVANLIGHEGKGSLHELLTGKGWITSLAAGESIVDATNSVMNVDIELTEEGAGKIPEVTGHLFDYLTMLQSHEIEKWIYDEQAMVAQLGFRFREKSRAMSTVQGLAPGLQEYPTEDLLIANFLMEEFQGELIRSFLSYLRPDNVLMMISGPDVEGSKVEPWFEVPYELAIGSLKIADVNSASLHLPEENPFMPESLVLVSADSALPTPVVETGSVEILLDTDVEFRVPRAVTHISIRPKDGLIDIDDVVNAGLYISLVQDDLNALAYPALLAGVSYQIASPPKGFRVSIGGYQDKQLTLLDEVLARLVGLAIDEERFAVIKADMLRDLFNSRQNKPYQQSYAHLRDQLVEGSWTPEEMITSLESVTPSSLTDWRNIKLSATSIQSLVIGNVDQTRVASLLTLLERHFALADIQAREPEVSVVSGVNELDLEIDHADASMVLYVQDAGETDRDRALSSLLTHLIAPGFFSSLRTEQQLGYVVTVANTVLREQGGISFVIQSPVAPPRELRSRTKVFMDSEVSRLAAMSVEEFEDTRGGLLASLRQKDKNLSQRASRYWSELDRNIRTFNSRELLATEVEKLSREDMILFLNEVRNKLDHDYVMISNKGKFAAPGGTALSE
jgi:insulysin